MLTISEIKKNGWLVFEVVAGSRAYGLQHANSDTDIRGVFILPQDRYYAIEYIPQVNNDTNDIVYYELKRFFELLSKNNPNIMELLNVPEDCILYKHPLMGHIKPELFLSRLCERTFANYAYSQIKKAYGLEKKIVNPVEKEKKSVLDFCYVYIDNKSIPVSLFLASKGYVATQCGLAAINHLHDCYNLYHSEVIAYSGIVRKEKSNEVCLSSIPKGETSIGLLYFNRDGYAAYCKTYKEYWEWVEKRNENRYKATVVHGKNYDAKNMMHVFRLLLMAKEIAVEGSVNVKRKDRDFLLDIKAGNYEYDDLVKKADQIKAELPVLFRNANLPEEPDVEVINKLLVNIRKAYYMSNDI